jgi:molecular chaperone DnaJ
VVNEARTIKVKVPAGIEHGQTLRLKGMGEAVSGGTPGDLYVRISVTPHKNITRSGNDLYVTLHIKLTDAILGAQFDIETLDGIKSITVPAHSQIGDNIILRDLGVPVSKSKRGNFIVKLHITLPKKLSKEAKRLIEELRNEGI